MKTCPRCKRRLGNSSFAVCRNRKDGLQVYCRDCHRPMVRRWTEKQRAEKNPEFLEKRRRHSGQWKKKNREKHRAHWLVEYAVKSGKLERQPCEVCGDANVQAHHDDYDKPLEVRWLCPLHHRHERKD